MSNVGVTTAGVPRRPRPGRSAARRALLAISLAVALVATGACGGDDDDAAPTTAAEETGTTDTVDPEDDPTETSAPLDDDAFAAEIAAFDASIENAGTDPCALNGIVTGTPPPDPANSAQTEQLVGLYAGLLRAIGASVPDAPEVAAGFSGAADDLEAEAAEAGYPADLLSSASQLPPSLASEEFLAANTAFSGLVDERCEFSADLPPEGEAPTG